MKTSLAGMCLLVVGCSSEPLVESIESVEQTGLAKRSTSTRWRIDDDGTYTIRFYANPANGFVVPPKGTDCPTTGTACARERIGFYFHKQ